MAELSNDMVISQIFKKSSVVMGQMWGDVARDIWWPIILIDLDTGLCKIDVCGKMQNCHIDDFARVEDESRDLIVDQEWFYDKSEEIENG